MADSLCPCGRHLYKFNNILVCEKCGHYQFINKPKRKITMKLKLLTTLALSAILSLAKAQSTQKQVKLPEVVKLSLTAQETASIAAKIDTLVAALDKTTYPAVFVNDFKQRLGVVFSPFYRQVNAQLIKVDSVKTSPKQPKK